MGILTLIKWLLFDEDNGYYDLDISVKINIFSSLAKRWSICILTGPVVRLKPVLTGHYWSKGQFKWLIGSIK